MADMDVYHIVDYSDRYEPLTTSSKPVVKPTWVKLPIKHRGEGVQVLLAEEHGLATFGVWCLLLQHATAKPHRAMRGYLLNHQDQPATVAEIALGIQLERSQDVVEQALDTLVDMGWIERTTYPLRSSYVAPTDELRKNYETEQRQKQTRLDKNTANARAREEAALPLPVEDLAKDPDGIRKALEQTFGLNGTLQHCVRWLHNTHMGTDGRQLARLRREIITEIDEIARRRRLKKPAAVFVAYMKKEHHYPGAAK